MKMGRLHAESRRTAAVGRLIGYRGCPSRNRAPIRRSTAARQRLRPGMRGARLRRREDLAGPDGPAARHPPLHDRRRPDRRNRPRPWRRPGCKRVTSAGSRAAACRSSTRGGPSRPRFRALGLPGHGERKASNAYGGTAGLPVTFERPKLLASLSGPLPFFARFEASDPTAPVRLA
jgi:hypothetical protein